MPTLPNTGIVTPTLGADSGAWDDKINACFANYDDHDHTTGKGLAITVAALDIDDDLPMGGHFISGLGKVSFTAIAAPSTGSKSLFVNTSDNELYWRTNGGTNVKLTSGTSINTTLVGGIVGDYTSVSAEVAFDDANDRYTFKQNSATGWARLAAGEVRIYETGTSDSVYVGHAAAAGLAVSYTVTWPAAVAAETVIPTVDSSGNVSFARRTKVTTIPASKGQTYSYSTGLHGTWIFFSDTGGFTAMYWLAPAASATAGGVFFPIELEEGQTVTDVLVYIKKNSNASTSVVGGIYEVSSVGAMSIIQTDAEAGNAIGDTTLVFTTDFTAGSNKSYVLHVGVDNASPSAQDRIYSVKVTYTTAL